MRRVPALLVAVVGLGGCAPDEPADDGTAADVPSTADPDGEVTGDDDPTAADDDPTAADDPASSEDDAAEEGGAVSDASSDGIDDLEFTRCESDDIDVDHPASWTVYDGEDVPPCRVFHPEEIDDFEGESLHYAVRLYIDPVDFEDATGSPLSEELSREETTVDGREAVVIERRSQGEAMIPEGERSYTYVVDIDGAGRDHEHGLILVGTTTTIGDTDYELDQRVLDRMMESISIDVEDEA